MDKLRKPCQTPVMEPTADTTVSRHEAADMLGISLRTLDRIIPEGTPGRTRAHPHYREARPNDPVRIERKLIEDRMPAPGGDTDAED